MPRTTRNHVDLGESEGAQIVRDGRDLSIGGWRDSLFGDLHTHGADGVRLYTRSKAVTERWPDPHDRGIDLGFPPTT